MREFVISDLDPQFWHHKTKIQFKKFQWNKQNQRRVIFPRPQKMIYISKWHWMAQILSNLAALKANSQKFCSTHSFGNLAQFSHGFNPLIFLFLWSIFPQIHLYFTILVNFSHFSSIFHTQKCVFILPSIQILYGIETVWKCQPMPIL